MNSDTESVVVSVFAGEGRVASKDGTVLFSNTTLMLG
jgi:hypothetical protein